MGSYVFTDPKGELYDKTAGYLKSKGYDIKIFNLVNPKNSDGYNPLMHIQNEIDVDIIANTIVKGQSDVQNQSDPYWDDMAEMLLKALIYYLLATRPEEEQNLASCALSCSLLHVNFTTINSFFKNFIYIEGCRTGKI